MDAIFTHFAAAYPGVTYTRVYNPGSNGVMDSVLDGTTHMTELVKRAPPPVWTFGHIPHPHNPD